VRGTEGTWASTKIYETTRWAISIMREEPIHFRRMQRAAMQKKQGWDVAARAYEAVYQRALKERGR